MTTADDTTPQTPLEIAQAHRLDLVARMRAGDATVTADDFERAESALRFAEMQERVAAERAAQETERVGQERIAGLVQALAAHGASATVAKATSQLEQALDRFVATCAAYNATDGDLVNQIIRLPSVPPGLDYHPSHSITVSGQTVKPVDPQLVIARTATEAVRRYVPRGQIDFGRH